MSAVGTLALLMLLTGWLVVVTRDLTALVTLSGIQGLLLAMLAALTAAGTGEVELFIAAFLTLVVKGLAVPAVLQRVLRRIGPIRLPDAVFTTRITALLALALTGAGYYIAAPLAGPATGHGLGHGAGELIPAALALVLVGTFVVVSRRLAVTQAVGLLLVENGLFVAALGVAGGVPLAVDIAILVEVMVAVLVMSTLVRRMHRLVGSISTQELRQLRG